MDIHSRPGASDSGGEATDLSDVIVPQVEFLARHALSRALDDEIALRGSAQITETLAVYLEFRIAEVMRQVLPESNPKPHFDA